MIETLMMPSFPHLSLSKNRHLSSASSATGTDDIGGHSSSSDVDSRGSTPLAPVHVSNGYPPTQYRGLGCDEQPQPGAGAGGMPQAWGQPPSPPSPRSACSTPGGGGGAAGAAATSGGLLLHSLLFAQSAAQITAEAASLAPGGSCGAASAGQYLQAHARAQAQRAGDDASLCTISEHGRARRAAEGRCSPPALEQQHFGGISAHHPPAAHQDRGLLGSPQQSNPAHAGSMHQRMLRARDVRRSSSDCASRVAALAAARASAVGALAPPGRAPPARRFSISRAKSVLAECAASAGDRGELVACETGVLSPLLARIRADGAVPDADCGASDCCGGCASRRGSSELWPASSRCCADGAAAAAVMGGQRASADGGDPLAGPRRCAVLAGFSGQGVGEVEEEDDRESLVRERRQRLLDCLETVCYLSVDDTNRAALVSMGAPRLLAEKFAEYAARHAGATAASRSDADDIDSPSAAGGIGGGGPSDGALAAAALRAAAGLLRSDGLKREFWAGRGGEALIAVLECRPRPGAGDLGAAAYSAAEALGWTSGLASVGAGAAPHGAGAPALYLSSGIYGGSPGGSAAAVAAAAAPSGAQELIEPRLLRALGSGRALHPRADPAAVLPALELLTLAQKRRLQAARERRGSSSGGSGPRSPCAADELGEQQISCAWRGVAFGLVPLLVAAAQKAASGPPASQHQQPQPPCGAAVAAARMQQQQRLDAERQQRQVVAAALDLAALMAEAQELASALCAAGALPPMLALLLEGGGSGIAERAAVAVAALARRGGPCGLARLREGGALAVLLRAAAGGGNPPAVRVSALRTLARAAEDGAAGDTPRAAAVAALRALGAPRAVRLLMVEEAQRHGELQCRAEELLSALGHYTA